MQVTDEMVEAFQNKYRELWAGSWPDSDTSRELLTAALEARREEPPLALCIAALKAREAGK